MIQTTLTQYRTLKLAGLASALEEQLVQPGMISMSFEERLAMLVDREVNCRNDRQLQRLLKNARLKYGQACIEELDSKTGRGINRSEVMSLALGDWVSAGIVYSLLGRPAQANRGWPAPWHNMPVDAATLLPTSEYPAYRKSCVSNMAVASSVNGCCN